MATKKRTVDDANFEVSVPSIKRRKLNDNDQEASASLQTIPLSTQSPSTCASVATNPLIKGVGTTEITPPACNPAVNNVNIETSSPQTLDSQNDHTAKAEVRTNANDEPSNWSFGNNSWVRQSSATGGPQTVTDSTSAAPNPSAFEKFAGLGFQKVLDDQNSKEAATKPDTEASKLAAPKETNDNNKNNNDTKETENPWSGAWSNSNPDGSFKLNFDWGHWQKDNANIDLNPNTNIGWGSTAKKYDPNDIEEDDGTKQVVEQMGGKQDTGDADDEVKYSIHCKVYNLESGRYVERGKGILKLNTYGANVKEEGASKKMRGRILCRRDQTLTTLINAPILKEMKFEKESNFIRFGVVNVMGKEEIKENGENVKKEVEKEEEVSDNGKVKKEDDADSDEDDDMRIDIKTYLIRPLDKTQLDILLNQIKEIQEQIG